MKQSGPIVDILCIILGIVTRKVRITEKIWWKTSKNSSRSKSLSSINQIWTLTKIFKDKSLKISYGKQYTKINMTKCR